MADDAFIDIDLGDAVELQAVDEGEYTLVCQDAELDESDAGKYVILRLEIPDVMESKRVTHVMMLPGPDDDPKQANNRKLALRDACEAFGIDWSGGGFNVSDFVNQEADGYLTVEEDEEYGRQNRVSRWTTGASTNEETNRSEELALE